MTLHPLLAPILVPAIGGAICLLLGRRLARFAAGAVLVAATAFGLVSVLEIFHKEIPRLDVPLGGLGLSMSFRADNLTGFILLAAAVIGLLVSVYAAAFMADKPRANVFFAFYLFALTSVNGAVLADHLVSLLFFWEGMMVALFVMIALGHEGAYRTAIKAFFITGVADLCMLAGIGVVGATAHTLVISQVHLQATGLAGLGFVLLAIGATAKGGSMPFHSWIPDAAVDAPTPFMALLPAAMEKLLGIYFLARISLDMFTLGHGWASTLLMVVGAVTLLLAVLMALVQKDFKRLLAFHAISQVGYMILGIGTGTAAGIVGGLFHMVNNAIYKCALFLSGGAVEKQAGTTDLKKIGGLAASMPVTSICFTIAALSISGVPLFNGFYSKELIYDGALERSVWFYAAAATGSFFTAASFLKLGHAAFFGKYRAPEQKVTEAPAAMLVPMIVLAAFCVIFGLGNQLMIDKLIVPGVESHLEEGVVHHLSGPIPHTWGLVAISAATLLAALVNHLWGAKRTGEGLGAVDHIHYAPVAHQLYDAAERRAFDPYEIALKVIGGIADIAAGVDKGIDLFYDQVCTAGASAYAAAVGQVHTGRHSTYLAWSLVGTGAVVVYLLAGGF